MKNILLGGIVLVLTSCGSIKTEALEVHKEMSEEAEVLESGIQQKRSIYRETETIATDLVHTKLEVSFDWPKSRMNGVASITAKPHFYASDELILDAKGMIINSVELNKKRMNFEYKEDFLKYNYKKI